MPREIVRSPALKELKRLCKQQVGQLGLNEKRLRELSRDPDRCEEKLEMLRKNYKLNKQTLIAYQHAYKNVQWAEKNA